MFAWGPRGFFLATGTGNSGSYGTKRGKSRGAAQRCTVVSCRIREGSRVSGTAIGGHDRGTGRFGRATTRPSSQCRTTASPARNFRTQTEPRDHVDPVAWIWSWDLQGDRDLRGDVPAPGGAKPEGPGSAEKPAADWFPVPSVPSRKAPRSPACSRPDVHSPAVQGPVWRPTAKWIPVSNHPAATDQSFEGGMTENCGSPAWPRCRRQYEGRRSEGLQSHRQVL